MTDRVAAVAVNRDMNVAAGVRPGAGARPIAALARRLLGVRPARKMLHTSLIGSLVVFAVGCVIPTPLDEAPVGSNHKPEIVSGTPAFLGGTVLVDPYDATLTFSVKADDLDLGDSLEARLYRLDGSSFVLVQSITLVTVNSNNLSERSGDFTAQFCSAGNLAHGQQFNLFIFVSDIGFPKSNDPRDLAPEHSDSRNWVLTCK